MSTHRKIEIILFLLGLLGLVLTLLSPAGVKFHLLLFGIIAILAGLHVVHRVDGRRANQIVLGVSLLGIVVNLTMLLDSLIFFMRSGAVASLILIVIIILSLRLRMDFTAVLQ